MIILSNPLPPHGAPIDTIINHKQYVLPAGETMGFEDEEVAKQLQGVYEFLEEVKLDQSPKGGFKCPYCDYTHDAKIAVLGHMRSHKDIEDKDKGKAPVEMPKGSADVPIAKGKTVVSYDEQIRRQRKEEFDELVGKDKDGVEWEGKGLEKDNV